MIKENVREGNDMSRSFDNVVVTNMVRIYDREKDMVVVQKREKGWCGYAFPGGHLEFGESVYDSAVREIKEETGLTVSDLRYCGLIHWYNTDDNHMEFIHFYHTENFEGTLIPRTEEGPNFWMKPSELAKLELSPGLEEQIKMFDNDRAELFYIYNDRDGVKSSEWFGKQ